MKQRGRQQRQPRTFDLCSRASPRQMIEDLLHQVRHAEAVGEPRMVRARIGEVAHAQLMDATQPLHSGQFSSSISHPSRCRSKAM
jgi:hypothetical protein